MKKTHICFIVPGYPTKKEPVFTFVRQLITKMADLGLKCTVIAPTSITNNLLRRTVKRDYYWEDITDKGNIVNVIQPKTITFSNVRVSEISITSFLNHLAILKTFEKLCLKPDIIYAHFWDYGLTASVLGEKYNIPTFVATGESQINIQKKFPSKMIKKNLGNIDGVIAVSTKNKNESLKLKLTKESLIEVIPNAIDDEIFHPQDKISTREKLGFDKDDFIIAFTGTFNDRKGVLRVSKAIKNLEGVKALYIGSGVQEPEAENALHIGKLSHEEIPLYLNSSDLFILPTLAEGASNAIIEAMACGLPIISSKGSFNDDILFPDNSIRIDPMSIDAIRAAIVLLRDNRKKLDKMSRASIKHAESFNIEDRAKKILKFMNVDMLNL